MAIGIGIGIPFGKSSTPNPVAQAPVNTSPPVISPEGNQVIGTVFTSGNGSWFATRPLTFEYRWTRNGTPISGATSQTYTSVTADEGQTLRCEVRATNAFGVSSYIASSNSSTGVSLPVNTVAPVISGSTTLGSVLTTTDGTWTGTSPITFSYQWKRGGVSIGGATSSTYTLVAADSSANITCEVTGTNVAGSVSANSNTITAQNFNPVNTIAPTLSPSGTQSTGTVITLGNGTWSGATPITFEYRWTRDNIVISGQTSNTYTIVAGDDGTVIKGEVRAINSVSTSAYVVTSNQVDAVAVPSFTGLLDLYPNSISAYSLRKLRAAYSGSAVRIRRSGDNAESDFGFDVNNNFNTAAAQTFCILGGGSADGLNTTFYDQANSYNATQSTAANQTDLIDNGVIFTSGVRPAIQGGSTKGAKTNTIPFSSYSEIWVYAVIDLSTTSGAQFICESSTDWNNNAGAFIFIVEAGNLFVGQKSGANYSAVQCPITTGRKIVACKIKANSSISTAYELYINGVLQTTSVVLNNPTLGFTNQILSLFSRNGNSAALLGKSQEVVLFLGDQSANNIGITSNINSYYNVY